MNWRERFARFMMGRYGIDSFSKTLLYISIIMYVFNLFLGSELITMISMAMLIYCYFRIFSRNVYKRANENQKYLMKTQKLRMTIDKYMRQLKTLKTHHIYKCPKCGQKIRIPRGKGRISIHCPKCNHDFIKKS